MNKFLLLAILLAAPCFSLADWHTLTSADGSKKIEAEILSYDAKSGTVTLKLRSSRKITSPASAFSEDDQARIQEVGLATTMGRSLWVEFEDVENIVNEKRNPTNGYQTKELQNSYRIELRNNGEVPFEGLVAEYQIFYAGYIDPFRDNEKTDQVHRGKMEIPALKPREETELATESVDLTSIKRLPLSQCSGGT